MTKKTLSDKEQALLRLVYKNVTPLEGREDLEAYQDQKRLQDTPKAGSPVQVPEKTVIKAPKPEDNRAKMDQLLKLTRQGLGKDKRIKPGKSAQHALRPDIARTPNLDARSDERLKRGKYQIDRVLDLHGHGLEIAHTELRQFIMSCAMSGDRCVLVITGKGDPRKGTGVIKKNFLHWINDAALRPYILSVRQAQPKDGGSGAYYVLLRRRR